MAELLPPSRFDGASMLDGYLTAIIIGPCSIPPDEWFVDLLGERGRIASASGSTLAAIKAIASHFNVISQSLSLIPDRYAPIFEKMDDGTVLAQPWCMGFLAAMQLRLQNIPRGASDQLPLRRDPQAGVTSLPEGTSA